MFDHLICKLAGFNQCSVVHKLVEVDGNTFAGNSSTEAMYDDISCFFPAHVFQHHYTTEDNGAGVHGVCIGKAGCCTMCRFKYGITGGSLRLHPERYRYRLRQQLMHRRYNPRSGSAWQLQSSPVVPAGSAGGSYLR